VGRREGALIYHGIASLMWTVMLESVVKEEERASKTVKLALHNGCMTP